MLIIFAKLEKFGICHRSIKPENILRGYDNEIKVSGFGCCNALMANFAVDTVLYHDRDLSNKKTESGGVPNYFSPERLELWESNEDIPEDQYFKSDVFSLGLVFA